MAIPRARGLEAEAVRGLRRLGPHGAPATGVAPGRVVCAGEHTDYAGGRALAFAIDARVAVAVAVAGSCGGYRLAGAADVPVVEVAGLGAHLDGAASWANLPLGVLSQLARRGHAVPPCRLQVAADLPRGAGLASSAAVTAATLVAALRWLRARLPVADACDLCWRAEHDFAGVPCGPMDPLVVIRARRGHALALDCRTLLAAPEPLRLPRTAWYVVESGVRHDVGGAGYRARREEWRQVAARLDAQGADARALGPADVVAVSRGWPRPLPQRLAHVVGENERVGRAARAAAAGDAATLGAILSETQASLRRLCQVGDPVTDRLTEALVEVPGVLGARVVGAGFGGAVLVLAGAAPDPAGTPGAGLAAAAAAALGHPARVVAVRPSAGAAELAPDALGAGIAPGGGGRGRGDRPRRASSSERAQSIP